MQFKAPSKGTLKASLTLASIVAVAGVVAMPVLPVISVFPAWFGYGGNPQHTAVSKYSVAGLGKVAWSSPVDTDLAAESDSTDVLIHYASPCITGINPITHKGNTVVIAVHNNFGGNHDGWLFEGLDGNNHGALKWSYQTDYSAPVQMPADWTSVYPLSLVSSNSVVAAGGGGTVLMVPDADVSGTVIPTGLCFYTKYATYKANPAAYANIKICTPITGDSKGNFYFGYTVLNGGAGLPSQVASAVGSGGIVKFNTAGVSTFKTVSSLINGGQSPAINCAPAISNDSRSIYVGVNGTGGSYLLKLDATTPGLRGSDPVTTLNLQASALMIDPYTNSNAWLIQESSASPMVAPDGHVFMGVFGATYRESHGWMLQFDANLNQKDAHGNRLAVGAFGWDDTASVVPASAVPSYKGASSYLILTKYNNYYFGDGGNGRNHVGILDPNQSGSTDWQSGIAVMTEVELVLGVTCDSDFYPCTSSTNVNDPSVPLREWCVNSVAVDVANKCAVVNSEDGHAYKWDFTTNTLQEATYLEPATGEAYTCTSIGPDGTAYAINNGVLQAIVPGTLTAGKKP